MSIYRTILFASLIAVAAMQSASADSPNVTAVLSNSDVAVGQTVQLQMRVSGSRNAEAPNDIDVDGLEIHRTGTEQHIEMQNFSMTSSVVYTYTILPLKAGSFKIPPQIVRVGGTTLKTPELTLHVSDTGGSNSASRPRSSAPRGQQIDSSQVGFLEFVVPKRDGYVGEMLPVEIKLGLNTHVQFQGVDYPDLNVQGVTLQKAQKPEETLETRNGVNYRVTTFKGALSVIRPGKLELPPLQTTAIALVRQSVPDIRNPFDDPFFRDPFELLQGRPAKVSLKSEPITLDIKSLPPNPPASFSGAVGHFGMNVEAKPKTLQVGDPITLTSTISGRGNFDRMIAPSLEDERGWHKYPPSGKFKADDDVGISGAKTFETVISPNERKTSVPPLSFSYFDPLKEDYVTLRSDAVPIQVEGNPIATAAGTAAAQAPVGQPRPVATAKPQDVLYQLTDLGQAQSFAPIYTRPVFWASQLVPFFALLGFAGIKIRRAKIDNREARRVAALEHESSELLRKLRRRDLSPQEYFSHASRAVRIKTALARNVNPNVVDEEMAQSAFDLDEPSREQLRRLFQRSDELRYSGAGNGSASASGEDRETILTLIESLRT
jgi:hypothetical protein